MAQHKAFGKVILMRINLVRVCPSGINWTTIENGRPIHGTAVAEYDAKGQCTHLVVNGFPVKSVPANYPFNTLDDFFNTADTLLPVFLRIGSHVFKRKWYYISPVIAFQFPGFGRNLNRAEKFFMNDYILKCGARMAFLCENNVSISDEVFLQMQLVK